jgi:hypothetical protein
VPSAVNSNSWCEFRLREIRQSKLEPLAISAVRSATVPACNGCFRGDVLTATCEQCGNPFTPARSTARFCGPTCRKAFNRANGDPKMSEKHPSGTPTGAPGSILSVTSAQRPDPERKGIFGHAKDLPSGIVADAGMFRIVCPDGSLSDMVNLTRAKDALRLQERAERDLRQADRDLAQARLLGAQADAASAKLAGRLQ